MSTLRESLDSLLDLQRIDSERDRLARALRSLGTGTEANAAFEAALAVATAAEKEQQATKTALKDAELELAGLEKKLKSYEDKMKSGTLTNTREIMNTEKELGQLVRQRSALDEKILNLMDQLEALDLKASSTAGTANQQDMARKLALEKLNADRERINRETADFNVRRVDASNTIADKALLKQYETIRARPNSAGIAIGRTQDNTCGGCHTQVSSIAAQRARTGEQMVTCDNCGRIMA